MNMYIVEALPQKNKADCLPDGYHEESLCILLNSVLCCPSTSVFY